MHTHSFPEGHACHGYDPRDRERGERETPPRPQRPSFVSFVGCLHCLRLFLVSPLASPNAPPAAAALTRLISFVPMQQTLAADIRATVREAPGCQDALTYVAHKVLHNIIASPEQDKFRRLNTQAVAFRSQLGPFPICRQVRPSSSVLTTVGGGGPPLLPPSSPSNASSRAENLSRSLWPRTPEGVEVRVFFAVVRTFFLFSNFFFFAISRNLSQFSRIFSLLTCPSCTQPLPRPPLCPVVWCHRPPYRSHHCPLPPTSGAVTVHFQASFTTAHYPLTPPKASPEVRALFASTTVLL